MVEFIQNYGLWIVLVGSVFLMHRLGIGCCGGHSHSERSKAGDGPKAEPRNPEADATLAAQPETSAATHEPRRSRSP